VINLKITYYYDFLIRFWLTLSFGIRDAFAILPQYNNMLDEDNSSEGGKPRLTEVYYVGNCRDNRSEGGKPRITGAKGE
jgi:hypothetical protein